MGRQQTRGWLLAGAALLVAAGCQVAAAPDVRSEQRPPGPASAPATPRAAEWQSQKAEFLALAERLSKSTNPLMGRGNMDALLATLASPELDARTRVRAQADIGFEHLRQGQIDTALEKIELAMAEAQATPELADLVPHLHLMRALSHLRRAEVQNCVQKHNAACCIFPLKGGAIHTVRQPALDAKQDLLSYLSLMPPIAGDAERQRKRYSGIWLLNIACMALDEYPDGVPPSYRIPPAAFESDYDIKRFVDVAPKLGLDTFDLAGGVIADDFDGDSRLDIVSSTCDQAGPMTAFRNAGDGTFENVSSAWRLDDQLGGLNIVSVDYDNDGRLDIFVTRGAWLGDDGLLRNSLLHNDGNGTFRDVTRRAGLLEPIAPTQTVAWADFDNDGWLDAYVGNESRVETVVNGKSHPSNLFHNNRDGTFTDVAVAAGVTNDRFCKGVAAGDYDNDGDMDLYLSNVGRNRLYRNNGDMTFTDVAVPLGVIYPDQRSFATWFFDYDNDGWLDIWVGAYQAGIAALAAEYLGSTTPVAPPCLYHNNGDGTFTDRAKDLGLARDFLPMGANFGDLDNDGWLDIYLGTGNPGYETVLPNVALRNDAGQRFQDVTQSGGLGHLQKGHGIAFADLDDDGDQDIYHQLGGIFPGDAFRNALFLNPGHGNRFLKIELVGTRTNRMATGARIKLVLATPAGRRELHRAQGSVASFGGSPRRQEIGLGNATAIERVEVFWPTSGSRQVFDAVPLDAFVRIVEGRSEIERLQPTPVRLDGPLSTGR